MRTVKAAHRGPLGGMIVICVEPGTEVLDKSGERAVVDEAHVVVSAKGALYVTPIVYEGLRARFAHPEEPRQ